MAATTYRDAGVDIDAGEELVRRIKPRVRAGFGPEVLADLGLFGGAFKGLFEGYEDPVLIASTDGVGTKTLVASWAGRHENIGRDLVHHCVNDIFTCGARPLFFLDYYACGKLDVDTAEEVIGGLADACRDLGVALIGGETAEMPDVYREEAYDLAGTIVGVVDRAKMITGEAIREGDLLVGLASSGLHTNGYSLARRVLIDKAGLAPDAKLEGLEAPLAEALLAPHRCYRPAVAHWLERGLPVHGMAHITGGGIEGNVARIIPEELRAEIEWDGWPIPPLFRRIMELGEVPLEEMRRSFNLGIGWVMAIDPGRSKELILHAMASGIPALRIGRIERR
ncbi:MAG TPA: phosphoribosylformylglycinamidine cyclo-ligase [Bacteroidetes bacterium]|nr:phosphoribosylformylglycinamidine cyclo-ligase [Bacteroidota bacterium]